MKWGFQPALRGKSWRLTIIEQRSAVEDHLADNPSLRSKADEVMKIAYRSAVIQAAKETPLDPEGFPAVSPWTFAQATDPEYWPE